ncbi:MAG: hypothetical protein OEV94_00520 [Deltaproteobacteria bacterium]|nr:hypothetical protein [Deltaproteobacteria bacterium]
MTRMISRGFPWKLGLLACCLVWGLPGVLWAQDIQIDSPSFEFNQETQTYTYHDARIRVKDLIIDAETVVIQSGTGKVSAFGRVRFQEKTLSGIADRLELNANDNTGVLYGVRMYDSKTGYYLNAEKVERTSADAFEATGCTLTNCPPDRGGWRLRSGSIVYRPDQFAVTYNTALELGGVPVLWVPVSAWPTVLERRTGVLMPTLSFEYSSLKRLNLGSRTSVPLFLNLGVDHDLTVTPQSIQNRGTAMDLEYNYAFWADQKGKLRAWGIDEDNPRNALNENTNFTAAPPPVVTPNLRPRRYVLKWEHNQGFGNTGRLVFRMDQTSDGQVLREYEKISEYRPEQVYHGSLSLMNFWGGMSLTSEHRSEYLDESVYANTPAAANGAFLSAVAPMATLLAGGEVFPWLGVQWVSSHARLATQTGVSGQMNRLRPWMTVPVTLGPAELRLEGGGQWVEFHDIAITDPTWTGPTGPTSSYTQAEGRVEFRLPFGRTWNKDELSEGSLYESLHHRLTPRLIFLEIQDVPQPFSGILFRPLSTVRMGVFRLDNLLLAKLAPPRQVGGELPPEVMAKPLATLNIIQRYQFDLEDPAFTPRGPALPTPMETGPGQPLLPLVVEGTYGGDRLTTLFGFRFHHQLNRITESSFGIHVNSKPFGWMKVNFSQNDLAYRTAVDEMLQLAGAHLRVNGEVTASDDMSVGYDTTMNLQSIPAPLERRLNDAQVYLEYHPPCYKIRAAYQEKVDLTTQGVTPVYFVDRRIILSFDLGGLVGTSKQFGLEQPR